MNTELIKTAYQLGYQKGLEKRAQLSLKNSLKLLKYLDGRVASHNVSGRVEHALQALGSTYRLKPNVKDNLLHIQRIIAARDHLIKRLGFPVGKSLSEFGAGSFEQAYNAIGNYKPGVPDGTWSSADDLLKEIGYTH